MLNSKLANIQNLENLLVDFLSSISGLFQLSKTQTDPNNQLKEVELEIRRMSEENHLLKEQCEKLGKMLDSKDGHKDSQQAIEKKDEEIKKLHMEMKSVEDDLRRKENMLGDYANRVNSLEIAVKEKKDQSGEN